LQYPLNISVIQHQKSMNRFSVYNDVFGSIINLVNSIKDGSKPPIIYVGIGAASTKNHQYPPSISKLKEQNPGTPVVLILIDSCMENPPAMCAGWEWKNTEIIQRDDKTTIFSKPDTLVTVFAIKCNAECLNVPERPNTHVCPANDIIYINVYHLLYKLIDMAKTHGLFLATQMYTGFANAEMAEMFDTHVDGHHSHIVIGISGRVDSGTCMLTMEEPHCYFVEFETRDRGIKVFNPYAYRNGLNELEEVVKCITCMHNSDDADRAKTQSQMMIYVMQQNIVRILDLRRVYVLNERRTEKHDIPQTLYVATDGLFDRTEVSVEILDMMFKSNIANMLSWISDKEVIDAYVGNIFGELENIENIYGALQLVREMFNTICMCESLHNSHMFEWQKSSF